MPGKSLATNLKRKRRALNDSQRLVQTSLDQDVPPLPPPRPGVRTHTVLMGLMALGHEGAPRRRLLAELRRAWAHHAPYDASQDEITRPLEDPPSLIPAVYLQRPKTGLEPSRVVLYPFVQHSVRHGDPLERYGGRHDAPSLVSRHRLQTLGT
jgi:hypothetical protein